MEGAFKVNVIQPALFTVINKFPNLREEAVQLFKQNENFRAACMDYRDCVKALKYWSRSTEKGAATRQREYEDLLVELEEEIRQGLEQKGLA